MMGAELGKRLRIAREASGYSQTELAKATGLEPSAISHFEVGRREPNLRNLCKIARATNVKPDYLLACYLNDDAKESVHQKPNGSIVMGVDVGQPGGDKSCYQIIWHSEQPFDGVILTKIEAAVTADVMAKVVELYKLQPLNSLIIKLRGTI